MAPLENQTWWNSVETESSKPSLQDIIAKLDDKFSARSILNDTPKINSLYDWYDELNTEDRLKLKQAIDRTLAEWYELISEQRSYKNLKKLLTISFANWESLQDINMPDYKLLSTLRENSWLTNNTFIVKKESDNLNNWFKLYWYYWDEQTYLRDINFVTWNLDDPFISNENSITWKLELPKNTDTVTSVTEGTIFAEVPTNDVTSDADEQASEWIADIAESALDDAPIIETEVEWWEEVDTPIEDVAEVEPEAQETENRAEIEGAVASVEQDSKNIFNLSTLMTITTHITELVQGEIQKLQEASDKELSKWFVVNSPSQYTVIEKLISLSSNKPSTFPSYSEIFSMVEKRNWSTKSFAIYRDGDNGFTISMIDQWKDWHFYTWEPIWTITKDWILVSMSTENWRDRVSTTFDEPKPAETSWEEAQVDNSQTTSLEFDVDGYTSTGKVAENISGDTEYSIEPTQSSEEEKVSTDESESPTEEVATETEIPEELEKINLIEYKIKKWETLWKIIKKKYGLRKNSDVVNAIKQIVELQPVGPIKDKLEKHKDKDWVPGQLINPWDKILLPDTL